MKFSMESKILQLLSKAAVLLIVAMLVCYVGLYLRMGKPYPTATGIFRCFDSRASCNCFGPAAWIESKLFRRNIELGEPTKDGTGVIIWREFEP